MSYGPKLGWGGKYMGRTELWAAFGFGIIRLPHPKFRGAKIGPEFWELPG